MSASSVAAHSSTAHAEHHELGFWRTYVFSTDHKMIGRQFLFLGLLMMILGGLLALVVRWQLAWPERPSLASSSCCQRRGVPSIPVNTTWRSPCTPPS